MTTHKKAFFVIAIAFGFTAHSQIIDNFGVKTGLSFSSQKWEYGSIIADQETDSKIGLYCALSAELFKMKHFSLVTDIGFVQKGSKETIKITTVDNPDGIGLGKRDYKRTLNNIAFVPALKFSYPVGKFCPYLIAAPRIDYRIGYSSDYFEDNISNFNKTTFGLVYGGGLEYGFGNFSALVEFQGQPDLTNLYDRKPEANNIGVEVSSNAYVVSVGLRYKIQK